LINRDEKEMIGFLEGIQSLPWFSKKFKRFLKNLIPFLICYGIGKFEMSELSALGVKVGHKNNSAITEDEE
jgi:hypothetical protein